ncbi:MAG: NAD(P)H-dependent oxidoreductase [Flavobacteriaceae bacterium]|nr:NAD(P)H-dependent oxidoreductase [Flavobacteriaceae bacterium]
MKIQIISSSIRDGRESHKVALFLKRWIQENTDSEVNIIDLKARNYPLFNERLSWMKEKHPDALELSEEIQNADAVIIILPEYNGGYPASLKNVVDVLYAEWQNKPIGLAPISSGDMAGAQVTTQFEFIMYKIGARVVKPRFHVARVQENFASLDEIKNLSFYEKNAQNLYNGLKEAQR